MPSQQELLDDVIKRKNKEIAELNKEITKYSSILGSSKNELSIIRTQIATEAKKTLADYESKLPGLEVLIKEKTSLINKLDKDIEKKNAEYNRKHEDLKTKFDDMATKLSDEYEAKYKSLSLEKERLDKLESELKILNDDIHREAQDITKAMKASQEDMKNREEALDFAKKEFISERDLFYKKCQSDREDIESQKAIINNKIFDLNKRELNISNKEKEVLEREKLADAVIAKEKYFDNLKKSLENRRLELDDKESKLNEVNVAIQAERNRLNKKAKDQELKEQALDKRDQLLKEAEAKV